MSSSERRYAFPLTVTRIALSVLLFSAGASCGSDGGSGAKNDAGGGTGVDSSMNSGTVNIDVGPIGTTPVEQCATLARLVCAKSNQCTPLSAADRDLCERELPVNFGCDRATSTDFPTCIADVQAARCNLDGAIVQPPSCDVPLNIELSDAQKQCIQVAIAICDRSNVCGGGQATRAQLDDCVANLVLVPSQTQLRCLVVTSVGPNYTQCLADIKVASCGGGASSDAGADDGGADDASTPATDGGGNGTLMSCDNLFTFP